MENKNLIKSLYDTIVSEKNFLEKIIQANASNLEQEVFKRVTPYHLALIFNELTESLENSTFIDVEDINGDVYPCIDPNFGLFKLVVENTKKYYLETYAGVWKTTPEKVLSQMKIWLIEI